ncbi:MAG TPA: HIT family protein [Burkholderiales bacterium]|nr:HIT family protein [Burkholderiales bacterium]
MNTTDCELCAASGGEVLWDDDFARVVLVGDADHPGFCRVILNAHCREMTDLGEAERARLMRIVYAVERLLRELLVADKINLASFGNLVPHLHWHVIPRFLDDPHFPNAVWGPRTGGAPRALPEGFRESLAGALRRLCT